MEMAAAGENIVGWSSKPSVTMTVAMASPCHTSYWWSMVLSGLFCLSNPNVCPISLLVTHYH